MLTGDGDGRIDGADRIEGAGGRRFCGSGAGLTALRTGAGGGGGRREVEGLNNTVCASRMPASRSAGPLTGAAMIGVTAAAMPFIRARRAMRSRSTAISRGMTRVAIILPPAANPTSGSESSEK
jgi:hypothetical protein